MNRLKTSLPWPVKIDGTREEPSNPNPTLADIGIDKKLAEQKAGSGMNKGTAGQLSGRDPSGGAKIEPPESAPPTLADIGIDKQLEFASVPSAALVRCWPSRRQQLG